MITTTITIILLLTLIAFGTTIAQATDHDEVLAEIQKRCEGLIYVSETDSDLQAFSSPRTLKGEMTPASFLAAMQMPPLYTIEEGDWEGVFDRHEDGTGRWTELRTYINSNTTNQRVYVTGTINRQVWVLGTLEDGRIVGVMAYTVET